MKHILRIFLILLFFTTKLWASDNIAIKWSGKQGLEMLQSSEYKNDFYELANYFQPQINPLYCSAASAVILLNAIANKHQEAPAQKNLEVSKPKSLGGGKMEFKSYSQLNFFNENTDKIKDRKIIELKNITQENENDPRSFDPGLSARELKDILVQVYDLKVVLKSVENKDDKTVLEFRNLAKKILADDTQYLLANFDGKVLGLSTRGHVSPIVAFDEGSDSVLIMDVAGHKNGWYWVKVFDLVSAMNTKDGDNYRGYLVISK